MNNIIEILQNCKKGAYVSLTKSKDMGNGITKESDMVIRLGISYTHMGINQKAGKAPDNPSAKKLPWGHWVEGLENLVIEHKDHYYLRITSTDPEEKMAKKSKTRYFKKGVEISKQEALEIVGEKKMKSHASPVYVIKFEDIISLKQKELSYKK